MTVDFGDGAHESARVTLLTSTGGDHCRLYVVRHGTTTLNKENRYRGRLDVPLDAQGYRDALEAARFLSPKGITAVYAGPLRRTVDTAQIIANEAGIADVRTVHGLTNLDYGAWEGMTAEMAAAFDRAAYELYSRSPLECACPNGERLNDAGERMLDALRLIGARHLGEAVAAVSHAVMIRLALLRIGRFPTENWRVPVGRGSSTQFIVDRNGRIGFGGGPGHRGTADVARAS